jgi:hypothetical protein
MRERLRDLEKLLGRLGTQGQAGRRPGGPMTKRMRPYWALGPDDETEGGDSHDVSAGLDPAKAGTSSAWAATDGGAKRAVATATTFMAEHGYEESLSLGYCRLTQVLRREDGVWEVEFTDYEYSWGEHVLRRHLLQVAPDGLQILGMRRVGGTGS